MCQRPGITECLLSLFTGEQDTTQPPGLCKSGLHESGLTICPVKPGPVKVSYDDDGDFFVGKGQKVGLGLKWAFSMSDAAQSCGYSRCPR